MRIKNIVFRGVMCALLCVTSPLIIPIGPVGLTLSTLVLGMICLMFNTFHSFMIVLIYMLLGCIGVPVFSGFGGGIGHILGPSGGFLIGYFPFLLCVSLAKRLIAHRKIGDFAALIIGYMILYLCGAIHYMYIGGVSFGQSVLIAVIPFILPDFVKIFLTLALVDKIRKYLHIY